MRPSAKGSAGDAGYARSRESCFFRGGIDLDPDGTRSLALHRKLDQELANGISKGSLQINRSEARIVAGALVAKQLIETGVRFVQVNRGGFDTHRENFPAMRNHGEVMDPALASLVEDLAESGRLEKTLVVMLSEFGRTPRINDNAGRDHHPGVFSCMIAGGGVRGGQVIGSSDKDGYRPKDRPVQVADIHATLCFALGINSAKEVMTPLRRPFKLVDGGSPVNELFG